LNRLTFGPSTADRRLETGGVRTRGRAAARDWEAPATDEIQDLADIRRLRCEADDVYPLAAPVR